MGRIVDGILDFFYQIKVAIVKPFTQPEPGLDAFLKTHGMILENGEGKALGYGMLTAGDSIIVTTTHAGVLDSKTQGGDWNPGNDVQQAVSFKLDPQFDMSGALQAVCVNDITDADELIRR